MCALHKLLREDARVSKPAGTCYQRSLVDMTEVLSHDVSVATLLWLESLDLQSRPPVTAVLSGEISGSALGSAPGGGLGTRGARGGAPEIAEGNWGAQEVLAWVLNVGREHSLATPKFPWALSGAPRRTPSTPWSTSQSTSRIVSIEHPCDWRTGTATLDPPWQSRWPSSAQASLFGVSRWASILGSGIDKSWRRVAHWIAVNGS